MLAQRKMAALGLTAGLLGGGAAGLVLGNSPLSGATGSAVIQDDTTASEEPTEESADRQARAAERLGEVLAPLVEDGTLTQAQADAVITTLAESMPERSRGGHRGGRGPANLDAAAEAIGIERSELVDALRDGSTIAEVAAAAGVDSQVVIDALLADAQERIAEKVAEGDLTQEEADEKLAALTERVTDMVNNGMPGRGGSGEGD